MSWRYLDVPSSNTRRRPWLLLPPRVAAGFAAALVAVVVAAGASFAAIRARTSASVLVRHTAEARFAMESIESALLVSHTAREAYLATGDPADLEQHLEAVSHLEPAVRLLERAAREHPDHAAQVAALTSDTAIIGQEEVRIDELLRSGDRAGARAAAASGRVREARARAIEAIDVLEAAEGRLHVGREAAWNRSVIVSNAVFAAAIAVLLALILLAARLVYDEIRLREREAAARERALLVQRRIVGVVSHDLRNPLAGILVGAQALSRGALPDRGAALANRIANAALRMERLIRDLLDWTRVEDGVAMPVSARPADLAAICRRAVDELGHADDGRVEVLEVGDTRGSFDPERIAQVVANLVSNGLRYGDPGAPVRVRAVGAPAELRVEVENTGPEIPPSERTAIFEPFRRGSRGDAAGVGLGLFIVRAVVEAHGGAVVAESSGGTTRFVVCLPRRRDAGAAAAGAGWGATAARGHDPRPPAGCSGS